jgi:uncharacterized protein YcaQ
MLYQLLYEDRKLIEYFDKNLSISKTEDFKKLKRIKYSYWNDDSNDEIAKVKEEIVIKVKEQGYVCSHDLDLNQKIAWRWMSTRLARAALEDMYYHGELVIHHRKGTTRYFSLPSQVLPSSIINENNDFMDDFSFLKWRILRRIKTVGLLWNKPSDAFLGIANITAENRKKIYQALLDEKKIAEITIEGINEKFYSSIEDVGILEEIKEGKKYKQRMEFLAPLDGFLWDRKIIAKLFNFLYTWEIYTPEVKRVYGYYVLPILFNDSFIGRIEMACLRKEGILSVKNIWFEEGVKYSLKTNKILQDRIEKFALFHEMKKIEFTENFKRKIG